MDPIAIAASLLRREPLALNPFDRSLLTSIFSWYQLDLFERLFKPEDELWFSFIFTINLIGKQTL